MSNITISTVVAEDEKRLARNIARHIDENPPFQVKAIFSNGEDAWTYIAAQPPRLLITDISMPLMDGIELVTKIHDAGLSTRCVILTGYADFNYAQAALRANVQDYLLKPVNLEELKNLLRKIEIAVLAETSEALSGKKDDAMTPEEIVSLVKAYVTKHYAEDISLNVLAAQLGFSASYLTKVFNKVENSTPSVYIREYRMNIARQLLEDPDATVVAVAQAVGYPDPFHFSKSFKQTFGYPPSQFKKGV
jgi:YesN/AraC family two-component response regulator